jgi:hypothetical protein
VDLISRSIRFGLEETHMRGFKLLMLTVFVLSVLSVGTAFAQSGGRVQNSRGPGVLGTGEMPNTAPAAETQGVASTLPFTGADITLFLAIGLGAIGTGMYVVRTSRPRQEA